VQEAGGKVTRFNDPTITDMERDLIAKSGEPFDVMQGQVIACNPMLHGQARSALANTGMKFPTRSASVPPPTVPQAQAATGDKQSEPASQPTAMSPTPVESSTEYTPGPTEKPNEAEIHIIIRVADATPSNANAEPTDADPAPTDANLEPTDVTLDANPEPIDDVIPSPIAEERRTNAQALKERVKLVEQLNTRTSLNKETGIEYAEEAHGGTVYVATPRLMGTPRLTGTRQQTIQEVRKQATKHLFKSNEMFHNQTRARVKLVNQSKQSEVQTVFMEEIADFSEQRKYTTESADNERLKALKKRRNLEIQEKRETYDKMLAGAQHELNVYLSVQEGKEKDEDVESMQHLVDVIQEAEEALDKAESLHVQSR